MRLHESWGFTKNVQNAGLLKDSGTPAKSNVKFGSWRDDNKRRMQEPRGAMDEEDVSMVGEIPPAEEERKIAPEMEMSRLVFLYATSEGKEKDTLKQSILSAVEKQSASSTGLALSPRLSRHPLAWLQAWGPST
jgi:hypothetical protein